MPSARNIEKVNELSKKLEEASAVYFTDYLGLDVASITDLRREFTKASVEYRVAKNTLLKLAAEKNNIEGLEKLLIGSTAIAISYDEPVKPAKVLKTFLKFHDKPTVKGILFEGDLLDGSAFNRLAELPSREELLGQLLSVLNGAMTKLVATLNAPLTQMVGALNQLKENKS